MKKSKDKKSSSKFEYKGKKRTAESVNRRAKQSTGSFDSIFTGTVTTYRAKEGENNVRIMPPTWDPDEGDGWEFPVFVHYGIGADEGTYLCLDKMKKGKCPICEARSESDDEDEERSLRSTWRALCYVIDRNDERAGPQLWSMPATLFREINARSIDKRTGDAILIDEPDEGFDISFTKSGSGIKTKYEAVDIDRDPSPISDKKDGKIQEKWLDHISENSIPDILNFYDEDYLAKVLTGKVSKKRKDDDDEDEDEKPKRTRAKMKSKRGDDDDEDEKPSKKSTPKKRTRADEDDDDEDDADTETESEDEDDDDEDDTPKRGSKSSAKKRSARDEEDEEEEDDEDEDTEDEDEEEDDDPPARGKKVAAKGKSKSKSKDDDDDDDEDDDDSDDEDEESDDDDDDDDDEDDKKSSKSNVRKKIAELKKKKR